MVVPDGGSIRLDDPDNPVGVYDLENTHATDMVLPLVESAGIGFVADLYTPGVRGQIFYTGPAEVLASLDSHGLTESVNLFAGDHEYGYATVADVQAAATVTTDAP